MSGDTRPLASLFSPYESIDRYGVDKMEVSPPGTNIALYSSGFSLLSLEKLTLWAISRVPYIVPGLPLGRLLRGFGRSGRKNAMMWSKTTHHLTH